jgi:hypothetical protein
MTIRDAESELIALRKEVESLRKQADCNYDHLTVRFCTKCGWTHPEDRLGHEPPQLWNHMFDVAFSVVTTKENPDDVTIDELIVALEDRLQVLRTSSGAFDSGTDREAFGCAGDSYLMEDDR